MINPNFLSVLGKIHKKLKDTDVKWVITGSLGFALQGVPIEPNDIDIQTDRKGAFEIEQLFREFIIKKVELSTTPKIRSYLGAIMIDGVKVEIMGDIQKRLNNGSWEESVTVDKYKQFIEIEEMQIPVLSLEYEYQAYLKLDRNDKAEMLRNWLDR